MGKVGKELAIPVKIKIVENGIMPVKAYSTSAGYDLFARTKEIDFARRQVKYMLGVKLEIPNGYIGLIFPRSSVYKKDIYLSNCVGIIDAEFRDEISAIFNYRYLLDSVIYEVGDRCCQIVFIKLPNIELIVTNKLSETDREGNGYGSTGK